MYTVPLGIADLLLLVFSGEGAGECFKRPRGTPVVNLQQSKGLLSPEEIFFFFLVADRLVESEN